MKIYKKKINIWGLESTPEEIYASGFTAGYDSGFTAGYESGYTDCLSGLGPDYHSMPLTFEILSDGFLWWCNIVSANSKTIEYSLNGGEWTSITTTTEGTPNVSESDRIYVNSGDIIQFRGNNESYGINGDTRAGSCNFNFRNAQHNIYGNIMSLIDGTNFATVTTFSGSYNFAYLFSFDTDLLSAENLILPATTLAEGCYYYMFRACRNLNTLPKLPATTLAISCYKGMFQECRTLTGVTSDYLPATTLAESCYNHMFTWCSNFIQAPELPAAILAESCYAGMFNGCQSLKYLKCLATDIGAEKCTEYWVYGVASSGTFVKDANMNDWTTGSGGIPSGWTVVDA